MKKYQSKSEIRVQFIESILTSRILSALFSDSIDVAAAIEDRLGNQGSQFLTKIEKAK
jgi:hypothetical protein